MDAVANVFNAEFIEDRFRSVVFHHLFEVMVFIKMLFEELLDVVKGSFAIDPVDVVLIKTH